MGRLGGCAEIKKGGYYVLLRNRLPEINPYADPANFRNGSGCRSGCVAFYDDDRNVRLRKEVRRMPENIVDFLEKIKAVKGEAYVEGLVAGVELASQEKEEEEAQ